MSRQRSLKTFVSLASAIAVLALPAEVGAQTDGTVEVDRATNGNVIAELSHRETDNFRVKITRDGAVLYDRPIGGRCNEFCMATDSALTGEHIGFRDLDGTGEPEVIVDVHTGGTSSCVLVFAFGYDAASNTYRRARGSKQAPASWRATTTVTASSSWWATTSASAGSSPAAPAARARSGSGATRRASSAP